MFTFSEQKPIIIKDATIENISYLHNLLDTGRSYILPEDSQKIRYYGIDIDDGKFYQITGLYPPDKILKKIITKKYYPDGSNLTVNESEPI